MTREDTTQIIHELRQNIKDNNSFLDEVYKRFKNVQIWDITSTEPYIILDKPDYTHHFSSAYSEIIPMFTFSFFCRAKNIFFTISVLDNL